MKLLSIDQRNELIARFMKYPMREVYGCKLWSRPGWQGEHETLRFHESWEWIMPVWIKFRDLFESPNTKHEDWINALQWYLFSSNSPKRFAERLAYAIKWYNSESKHPDAVKL